MAAPWSAGAELRIIGELHGSQTVNVMHFGTNTVINDDPARDTLLLALAAAMLQCVVETLLPAVTSDWKFKRITVKAIAPTVSDELEQVPDPPDPVGELSAVSTSFLATLCNIKTGGGGKSGRGKKFLPPPGETEITASDMTAPTLALVAEFIACVVGKFVGAGATEDWRFGVLSTKKLHATGGTFDNSFREATTIVASSTIAKLGSRKKGVGA